MRKWRVTHASGTANAVQRSVRVKENITVVSRDTPAFDKGKGRRRVLWIMVAMAIAAILALIAMLLVSNFPLNGATS
jgi:hypothetical protein